MTSLLVLPLAVFALAAGIAGCSEEDASETTTTTTTVVETTSTTTTTTEAATVTLDDLEAEIIGPAHPAYFHGFAFECITPKRTTSVSDAEACMRELRAWYGERRSTGAPAKYCTPFYRFICLPEAGDWDCPTVLRRYSSGEPVEVSRYADPLNLDADRDGLGCEPYE